MYKANKRHLQPLIISNVNDLPEKKRKQLANSWAEDFYHHFFSRIEEEAFAVLYVEHPSRPNVPINWLVALETLKAGYGWSDEELYDHFCFDLQVRYALGIHDLNESDFALRSLYNFRRRLSEYMQDQGVNLLDQAFEQVTDEQIQALQLKSGQQRMDSTFVASNIRRMGRLQLLVEVLQRVWRMLTESDQARYAEAFAPYLKGKSGQVVYRVKGEDIPSHLQQIGLFMYQLLVDLQEAYADEPVYQVLARVFAEHYTLSEGQLQVKAAAQLSASSLQSPDDLEASYREKGGRAHRGYVANISETCDPDNAVQLITKVQVEPNNSDDAQLLAEALPNLTERTDLETIYTDGGHGGPKADEVLNEQGVTQVQTAIRGRTPQADKLHLADFEIKQTDQGKPVQITCPKGQHVAVKTGSKRKGFVAHFDEALCQACPFAQAGQCPAQPGKRDRRFRLYFSQAQAQVAQRRRRSLAHKKGGRNLRAAVEATVRQVKHPFPAGKLPVRGKFRMTCMLIASAAMANVRRIQSYRLAKQKQANEAKETPRRAEITWDHPWISFCPSGSWPVLRRIEQRIPHITCFEC
jgi:ABC-type transporter MlaC component